MMKKSELLLEEGVNKLSNSFKSMKEDEFKEIFHPKKEKEISDDQQKKQMILEKENYIC